jgi:hypothetical protein
MSTQTVSMEAMLSHLQKIKTDHGDEAYEKARQDVALQIILKPKGEEYVKNVFPDIDIEELKATALEAVKMAPPAELDQNAPPEQVMLQMLREQIPNLQSEAQFKIFMAAFDALRATLNACFGNDTEAAKLGREALNKVLDTAGVLYDMAEKLKDMPDDVKSDIAKEFDTPAKEFHEFGDQSRLLTELEATEDLNALKKWYEARRGAMDRIVSQDLRNKLFDAIRQRRNDLTGN